MKTAAKWLALLAVVMLLTWVGATYGLVVLSFVLLVAMVPPATAFPVLYATRSPWYKSPTGRGLMLSSLAMALLVDFSVLFRLLGFPAPDWLRVLVFGLILTSLCLSVRNLLRLQRQGRAARST